MTINQTAAGAAVLATLQSTITPTVPGVGGTFTVDSGSGWPNTGNVPLVMNRGNSNEEKMIVTVVGTTFTVVQRGYDSTVAQDHSTGETIELNLPAAVVLALIQHVDDIESAPHSTKLPVGTVAGHDTTTRHTFGASSAFGTPGTPTAIVPDNAGNAGSGSRPAREDHTHASPAATAIAITGTPAEGVSTSIARADHDHGYGNLSIASAALAANAVVAGKIASGGVSATAQITDAIVTLAKFASEASTDYTPSAASFASGTTLTIGTGGTTYGHYFKLGRMVAGWAGFNMAADGNLPAGGAIQIPLPVAMRTVGADGFRCFIAARARRGSDGNVVSGTGVVTSGSSNGVNIAAAGVSATWDATTPFNWGTPGDGACALDALFFYEAAT